MTEIPQVLTASAMRTARWYQTAGFAPRLLRHWLTHTDSMTARLRACCNRDFQVLLLHQGLARAVPDEADELGLGRHEKIRERDVLLLCDGRPVIFAHTAVPLSATSEDWPRFGRLGTRPLGSMLFTDPLVSRSPLSYARLGSEHPLRRRARLALIGLGVTLERDPPLYARRCHYWRKKGAMLLTEILLPEISELRPLHRLKADL